MNGITDPVCLLLDHGADAHVQGRQFGIAWHAAAAAHSVNFEDWQDLIAPFLRIGVDVSESGGQVEYAPTALHYLLHSKDPWDPIKKIDFLLDCGADPTLSGDIYTRLRCRRLVRPPGRTTFPTTRRAWNTCSPDAQTST